VRGWAIIVRVDFAVIFLLVVDEWGRECGSNKRWDVALVHNNGRQMSTSEGQVGCCVL
jgi:hypothetical protein